MIVWNREKEKERERERRKRANANDRRTTDAGRQAGRHARTHVPAIHADGRLDDTTGLDKVEVQGPDAIVLGDGQRFQRIVEPTPD